MTEVQPLPWDSEFFGVSIGQVQLEQSTAASLDEIAERARALGIECLYGSLDEIDTDEAFLVQEHGFRLVEVALRFGRPPGPLVTAPSDVVVRRGTVEDMDRLAGPIAVLAPWSRFAADPRFGPEAAERMFRAWVERAAHDGEEHMCLVAEEAGEITGLCTNVRHPVPRIDLCGVVKPGSGCARDLMRGFIEWADNGKTEAGPCAARNIPVLRYVEHCGFSAIATQYKFHRWFDGGR